MITANRKENVIKHAVSKGKGRTIRKVMGGEGDFQLARIFFLALCLCRNFFCR